MDVDPGVIVDVDGVDLGGAVAVVEVVDELVDVNPGVIVDPIVGYGTLYLHVLSFHASQAELKLSLWGSVMTEQTAS